MYPGKNEKVKVQKKAIHLSPYMVYKVQDLRQNDGALLSTDLVLVENPSLPWENSNSSEQHASRLQNDLYLLKHSTLLHVEERIAPSCNDTQGNGLSKPTQARQG